MTDRFYKLGQALAARTDLTGNDKVLLAVIADRIGSNGYCWPGVALLASDTGTSRATVLEGIRRLETAGLLLVDRRGRGKANHYRLTGQEIRPVENTNQSENQTSASRENRPEVVGKRDPNQTKNTNPLNQTKKARRARVKSPSRENAIPFADLLAERPALDTAAFREAWGAWVAYRKEKRKALTKSTARLQLKDLAGAGPETAVAMIEQSIRQGWQGLFPLRDNGAAGKRYAPAQGDSDALAQLSRKVVSP